MDTSRGWTADPRDPLLGPHGRIAPDIGFDTTARTLPPHVPWLYSSHGEVPRTYPRCYACRDSFDHRWQWKATGRKFVLAVSNDGMTRAVVYVCMPCVVSDPHRQTHRGLTVAEETER